MSGPRRRGSRLVAATCAFVLLALGFVLLREGGASATPAAPRPAAATPAGGLLGGLGGVVGGVVSGVGGIVGGVVSGVLGPHRTPAGTTSAPPAGTSTTPASSGTTAPAASSPRSDPPTRAQPTPLLPSARGERRAQHSRVGRHSAAVAPIVRRTTASKSAPARTSGASRPSAAQRAKAVAAAFGDDPTGELDPVIAVGGVLVALVLGVGLIVYRAGYRGAHER